MPPEISFQQRLAEQIAALGPEDRLPEVLSDRMMPIPLWLRRETTDDPDAARSAVLAEAEKRADIPMGMYLHIPYCTSRCGYCDCYSFPLTPSRRTAPAEYLKDLCSEIGAWAAGSDSLRNKPVSTVHFGGGTPLTIGTEGLEQVTDRLREGYHLTSETQLALESTSAILNEHVLDELRGIGFNRLHIGVQSLDDSVRKAIGRHESGAEVLAKIRYAVSSGWIVSTDIIVGLPQYHKEQIRADLDAMIRAGVEGFSVYELVHSPRNTAFFEANHLLPQDLRAMYTDYQLAFHVLKGAGFSHLIYNHMAKGRDDNRYFTGPQRGEDLLSFGTIADGYFGDYIYRHGELEQWRAALARGGLVGGVRRTPGESRLYRLECELRSGRPDPLPFVEMMGEEKALALFRKWFEKGLIELSPDGSECELTPNGSWFIHQMIDLNEDCIAVR